jgi:GH15 family glucan-1,4-alpha-glucosidase
MKRSPDYLPIEDYGVIGDLRTGALVGRNGSIDWCCFPRLDCPSVFAALLDHRRGGRFRIWPVASDPYGEQSYAQSSNVLKTCAVDRRARRVLSITDLMPVCGDLEKVGGTAAPGEIRRLLECHVPELELELEWSPRFDYARAPVAIVEIDGGFLARPVDPEIPGALFLSSVPGARVIDGSHGPSVVARFRMARGRPLSVVSRWLDHVSDVSTIRPISLVPEATREIVDETNETWRRWLERPSRDEGRAPGDWAGAWGPMIGRSALVFKLLMFHESGAAAAAATTSLPETLGGVRNWDYRYAWIRDAAMTTQALAALGHQDDAVALIRWMERASEHHEEGLELRVTYGLTGEEVRPEIELDHLEGYRGSSPVRVGNDAAQQFQLEVFGELLNAAYELARRGKVWSDRTRTFLGRIADHVLEVKDEPDYGIWEMRNGPFRFTYSRVMAWTALDRAAHLARRHGIPGDVAAWEEGAESIRRAVLDECFDDDLDAFVMRPGTRDLDAALLRIPIVEFLPADDPRVAATVERIMEQLMEEGLVYRYRVDDGLPGDEGAFGLCTFWLVDVLCLMGRHDEAQLIFDGMMRRASRLGLFSEEIDPRSGAFLGNFPQAFTHIGAINSAIYLCWSRGSFVSPHPPIGTPEHRKEIERSSITG